MQNKGLLSLIISFPLATYLMYKFTEAVCSANPSYHRMGWLIFWLSVLAVGLIVVDRLFNALKQ